MSAIPRIVMTCTPLRLSFAGGGTDFEAFYAQEDGAVLSTTIDKFVYVTVKRHGELFQENYRLNYYDTEHAQTLGEIRNDIARECLRLLPVEPPIFISTVSDLPSSSGLGSSGAFAVGLLHALHALRGDRVSLAQLAEEACYVEIDALQRPIGKQDQYAAAFGGLNHMTFRGDGRVVIEPQRLNVDNVSRIFENIMLFWTRTTRASHEILADQRAATPAKMANLRAMKGHCDELRVALGRNGVFDPALFGQILDATWRAKKDITSSISNTSIDDWYERALEAGAAGGKISGAGGGGFLLLVVPGERQADVRRALAELMEVRVNYEATGTRLLIPMGH